MSTNNKSLLRLLSLIPFMQIMLIIGVALQCALDPRFSKFILLFIAVYIVPPLLWRLLSPLIPAQMGSSSIGAKTESVNGWFVSYQIQRIYNFIPLLESLLKCVPGLYSSWLRLWGARIGEQVTWTFKTRVIDRPFIHIGDRSSIGDQTYLAAHTIKKNEDQYLLYLKEIIIGTDVVVSLKSIVGPGVVIEDRAMIGVGSALLPNTIIYADQVYQ